MELSKEQVGRIDQFLKDRKVRHIDLRLELIDHLSTEMENQLQQVSFNSFDKVFQQIEIKYTAELLANIRKNKEKVMSEYWNRRFKTFWKSYFSLPKVIITLLLFTVFLIISHIPFRNTSLSVSINVGLCMLGFCIPLVLLLKSLVSNARIMIIESYAMQLMVPFLMFNIVYQIPLNWDVSPFESTWYIILLSFTNAIFVIALVGNITSFRFWIREEMEKAYPLIKSLP